MCCYGHAFFVRNFFLLACVMAELESLLGALHDRQKYTLEKPVHILILFHCSQSTYQHVGGHGRTPRKPTWTWREEETLHSLLHVGFGANTIFFFLIGMRQRCSKKQFSIRYFVRDEDLRHDAQSYGQ